MESVRREPVPALRGLVHHYHGFNFPDIADCARLEIPSGAATLVIAFAEPIRIALASDGESEIYRRASFLSAGRAVAAIGRHRGHISGIEVTLSHTGAHHILGLRMAELADGFPTLGEILRREGELLVEQLAGLPTWQARFARLDAYLTRRAADSRVLPAWQVTRATRLVAAGWPLREIQRDVGWGDRHLRSRFLEQVGMSPKAMARVLRLQTALRAHLDGRSWSQAAALARYHDQAHLGHDVKAITGLTPGRLAELRRGAPPGSALDRLPGRVTSVLLG
ncbi:helix-turn-helix domain-containing protein [Catenulispora rubra]|uniref:helix-turn-helix domain-containing protein n=1 Tax=Catenulispora rubra TaxID=280293 RepID=UPI001891F6AD|nr:helix-turn-helix domain-containing protein [Catenulispora rubra]